MLNPTKAGILITLSLFTDFVQIAILATSLGTQGAITVLTLGIGAAVAGAAGFSISLKIFNISWCYFCFRKFGRFGLLMINKRVVYFFNNVCLSNKKRILIFRMVLGYFKKIVFYLCLLKLTRRSGA